MTIEQNSPAVAGPVERRVRQNVAYSAMTVLDIAGDDALRFVQRVLESESTPTDRAAARELIVEIRTRLRRATAP